MLGGRIVETGGPDLAVRLNEEGYDRRPRGPSRSRRRGAV